MEFNGYLCRKERDCFEVLLMRNKGLEEWIPIIIDIDNSNNLREIVFEWARENLGIKLSNMSSINGYNINNQAFASYMCFFDECAINFSNKIRAFKWFSEKDLMKIDKGNFENIPIDKRYTHMSLSAIKYALRSI